MMKKLIVLSIISTIGLCFTLFVLNGLHQNDKLFEAIENNDYSAAEKAIERGAWINTRDDVYDNHDLQVGEFCTMDFMKTVLPTYYIDSYDPMSAFCDSCCATLNVCISNYFSELYS